MISEELLKEVRRLRIVTSRAVDAVFAGQYVSAFKGRGMEFSGLREYQPGDEVRTIDWNVTARAGRPFIKEFVEERELTVMLAVDLSGSLRFGSTGVLKSRRAAELGALLAITASRTNDRIGVQLFTSSVELLIPPKKGSRHVLRVIRELLGFTPQGLGTDLAIALETLSRVLHKRAVIFVISDFLALGFERPLERLARRHDLIAVTISDPRESELPDAGLLELEDLETGARLLVDTSDANLRAAYRRQAAQREGRIQELLRRAGVDRLALSTARPCSEDLVAFFRKRERRRR